MLYPITPTSTSITNIYNVNTLQVKVTPLQLTQQIFRQYGIQGLFRGLVPTIMREMPGYFFFFGGYEGSSYKLCYMENYVGLITRSDIVDEPTFA